MFRPSFPLLLTLASLLRVGLVFYSEYYDALPTTRVKYTDIDYRIYTDAAQYLLSQNDEHRASGVLGKWWGIGDPYERYTYRYTPLLALFMTPNIFLHPAFGKFFFSACDILMGVLLYRIVQKRSSKAVDTIDLLAISLGHLFNPLIFSISTRGSSESVLGLLVLTLLYYTSKGNWDTAAVWFGISVHWKIYPIIYGSSLLALLGEGHKQSDWAIWKRLRFAVISGGTFLLLGAAMYLVWGHPFLEHTYLYHAGRRDHRHNFSPYFYPTYLAMASRPPWWSLVSNPLMSFIPQMGLSIGTGFLFPARREHAAFTWFVQTVLFVAFNKVCTSQYFLWYMWFLPIIVRRINMSWQMALLCTLLWAGSQAIWLAIAYRLEFLGQNVFMTLWVASIGVFLAHVVVLDRILHAYKF